MFYFRNPRTTQELKMNQDGLCRAKRRRLPTVYDDLVRGDLKNRSWKKQSRRRRQYKETNQGMNKKELS